MCISPQRLDTTLQVRELTAIIRNQIPAGRKSILDAYGEIAFQAWRNTFGGCRFEVEHTLLQVRALTQQMPLHGHTFRDSLPTGLSCRHTVPPLTSDSTTVKLWTRPAPCAGPDAVGGAGVHADDGRRHPPRAGRPALPEAGAGHGPIAAATARTHHLSVKTCRQWSENDTDPSCS